MNLGITVLSYPLNSYRYITVYVFFIVESSSYVIRPCQESDRSKDQISATV